MPHALRIYRALKASAVSEDQALAIAMVAASAQELPGTFNSDDAADVLCEGGFDEPLAEEIARTLAACFPSERFKMTYARSARKVGLVRGGMTPACADALLDAIDPCIRAGRDREIRSPVRYTPGQGRVVMCDFRFLRKPEMQKERRAIVVSKHKEPGRCVVVPVSKDSSNDGHALHHRFEPGSYPFFHAHDPVWAVCDHVYTVSLDRLWQINLHRRPVLPPISSADLGAIKTLLGTSFDL